MSGKTITTLEGLPALYAAQRGTTAAAPALHPLQQAWIDVQVPHCGYCQNGSLIQAADPVVGFSLVGSGLAGRASAPAPTQSGYLPDLNQVDSWVTIGADDTVTLKTSQIEVGNGITTGL